MRKTPKVLRYVVGSLLLIIGVGYLLAVTWEDAEAAINVAKWLVGLGVGLLLGPRFFDLVAKVLQMRERNCRRGESIDDAE